MIAAAGVSFAVLLYVRFERRAPVAAPPLPAPLPKDASYQSTMAPGGRQCRSENGKEISCVSYAKFTQFTDGRRIIEQPRFEGDRGGKPFVVSADRGELRAASPNAEPNEIPDETHLIGHVVMREQDGMEINTDDATYQETAALLTIPGALTFHRGRLSGSGVGASYSRPEQLLKIADQAKVLLATDDTGKGKLDGQSQSMELNRNLHSLVLTGNAVIVRDEETIRTDVASMHLTDDEQGIAVMQMRGHSGIVPLAAGSNAPEMHGDDIDLEFHPDGRTIRRALMKRQATLALAGAQGRRQVSGDTIDASLAPDGQTVSALTASPVAGGLVEVSLPQTADAPRRIIRARQMNGSGDEKVGLSSVVFQQNVEFIERQAAGRGTAAIDRRATSRQLVLSLNAGDIGNINDARFRENVRFQDGATVGIADDVKYIASKNTLVLRTNGAPDRVSEVDAERINVKARDIDIGLEHTSITAAGKVQTKSKPGKDQTKQGLFDASQPVFGSAATLRYDDSTSLAQYEGTVFLWQGAGKDMSRIQGDKISLDDTAGDLTAEGHVVTYLPMDNVSTAASGGAPPKSTAATLRYTDAKRRAVYEGTAKELAEFVGPDGTVKAVTIDLTLAAEGRELQRMIADTAVAARVSAEQTARGEHLDYDVKPGRYTLDGAPAKLIQKKIENGTEKCSQTLGVKMVFTRPSDGGSKEVTIGTTGTGTATQSLTTCQDWTIK